MASVRRARVDFRSCRFLELALYYYYYDVAQEENIARSVLQELCAEQRGVELKTVKMIKKRGRTVHHPCMTTA